MSQLGSMDGIIQATIGMSLGQRLSLLQYNTMKELCDGRFPTEPSELKGLFIVAINPHKDTYASQKERNGWSWDEVNKQIMKDIMTLARSKDFSSTEELGDTFAAKHM